VNRMGLLVRGPSPVRHATATCRALSSCPTSLSAARPKHQFLLTPWLHMNGAIDV
jgi:hypothetical protein